MLTDDLIRSPGQVPRGFGAGRVTCSATARSPRGPGPAALGLRALQLLRRGSNMTSDDDMLWRRCAYLGRVLLPLLDQELWRQDRAESGCGPGASARRWGNDSSRSSRPRPPALSRWTLPCPQQSSRLCPSKSSGCTPTRALAPAGPTADHRPAADQGPVTDRRPTVVTSPAGRIRCRGLWGLGPDRRHPLRVRV